MIFHGLVLFNGTIVNEMPNAIETIQVAGGFGKRDTTRIHFLLDKSRMSTGATSRDRTSSGWEKNRTSIGRRTTTIGTKETFVASTPNGRD
jgi:hypothetical protein